MKAIRLIIGILVILFAVNINARDKSFDELEQATYPEYLTPKYLTGLFDGKNFDTIGLFPVNISDEYYEDENIAEYYCDRWLLMSKHGTVPSREFETYWPQLIDEGDLDCNGTTEFGILYTGVSGCWCGYQVFDIHKGKLREFTPDLFVYMCGNITPEQLVWREDGKIKYLVKEWDYSYDDSFPTWIIRVLKR